MNASARMAWLALCLVPVLALGACGSDVDDEGAASGGETAADGTGGGETTGGEGGDETPPPGPDDAWIGADQCIGPLVTASVEATTGTPSECPTCIGSPLPDWTARDANPLSCGYGHTYGLDAFEGDVQLVVLLSAGCSYCLQQMIYFEQLRYELDAGGHAVDFATVNLSSMASRVNNMTDRASFAIFQDTDALGLWDAMGGRKDDIYIYRDGVLVDLLPVGGGRSTNLSTEEGYANVRQAVLDALDG